MKKSFWIQALSGAIIFVIIVIVLFSTVSVKNNIFSCPLPSSLYALSKNPVYHGMSVEFDDKIKPNILYNFMRTRVNFRFNNKWQCSYYSNKNSPVMVSMNEPAGGLDEVGDSWASYHGQDACDQGIDNCKVMEIPKFNPIKK